MEQNKYLTYIDLKKAFDRINRERLWKIRTEEYHDIQPKLVRIIKNMCKECKNKVKSIHMGEQLIGR